jgi:hypothetical protein
MKRFFTFAVATILAAGVTATTVWSQSSGGGGGSGSAGAGASGSAGTSTGTGASGTAGTATSTTGTATGTTGTATGTTTGAATGTGTATGTTATTPAGTVGAGGTTNVTGAQTNPALRGAAAATGRANTGAGFNGANARTNMSQNTFNGISPTPFFTDPGVGRQLNLNANQTNALNRAYQTAYFRYNQALKNLNPNLTPEQRDFQLQQLQAQFNQDLSGTLNTTFTDPQLLGRYNQLNTQFMGFNAFNNPRIRQQLNLTPDQTRQIRTLANNWRQQLQQFRRGAGNDLSNVDMSQWNQMWQQYATQLNAVLTPDQQQLWTRLVGQPYTFSPNVYLQSQFGTAPPVTTPDNGTNPVGLRGTPPGTSGIGFGAGGTTGTTPGTQQPRAATTQGTTTQGTQGGTVR